jgi:hypothetical protein
MSAGPLPLQASTVLTASTIASTDQEISMPVPASAAPRSRPSRAFTAAIVGYIGFNIVATVVGVLAGLPDVTTTHATTDAVPIGQVFFPDGTIISPPLVFMIVAALLLWGVQRGHPVWSRVCAVLLILGAAVTSLAEVTGLGSRPALFSAGKWHIAVVTGSIYGAIGLAVVVTGLTFLLSAVMQRRRRQAA